MTNPNENLRAIFDEHNEYKWNTLAGDLNGLPESTIATLLHILKTANKLFNQQHNEESYEVFPGGVAIYNHSSVELRLDRQHISSFSSTGLVGVVNLLRPFFRMIDLDISHDPALRSFYVSPYPYLNPNSLEVPPAFRPYQGPWGPQSGPHGSEGPFASQNQYRPWNDRNDFNNRRNLYPRPPYESYPNKEHEEDDNIGTFSDE